jgi:glycosyltransferase involved in cell wall biosynthesis
MCYNHARFVGEAIESVLGQTYPHIELLVVDDASTDNSRQVIDEYQKRYPNIRVLYAERNQGHCRMFNQALRKVRGDYVIDLAADDVLLPERISQGINDLEEAGKAYGVHYGDAMYISDAGSELGLHSDRYPHPSVLNGDVYLHLISRYFICPPSVMFRKEVLDALQGYDETLQYEDFDILIRAARSYRFFYTPRVLIKRRVLSTARSRAQFRLFSRHSRTTYRVCRKIMDMNRSQQEQQALNKRLLYEMRLNLRLLNFDMAWRFAQLWMENRKKCYHP